MSTATVVHLGEEADRYTAMRAELAGAGYRDAEHPSVAPGHRIRHRAEQWPEAWDLGTGVVLAVMERPDSAWSQSWGGPDIELIVLKDRPLFEGSSRLSQLANYHVAVVKPSR